MSTQIPHTGDGVQMFETLAPIAVACGRPSEKPRKHCKFLDKRRLRWRSVARLSVVVGGGLSAIACERGAVAPTDPDYVQAINVEDFTVPDGARDIAALTMSPRPQKDYAWLDSDDELVKAVDAEDGLVIVAFKQPESARLRETGLRAAVTKETVGRGFTLLQKLGAQITHRYFAIGAVAAHIDPVLAPQLRKHPLVDYIEPETHGKILGVFGGVAPADAIRTEMLRIMQGGQVVPWGISLSHFPSAWSHGANGGGVKILVIDTGYDRGHEDLPNGLLSHCGGVFGGCTDGEPTPHGSHVSGIAVARQNSVGVKGGAWNVANTDFYAWGACSSQTGACLTSEVIAGLNEAVTWDVDVVNMSLRLTPTSGLENAVAAAWWADIVLVAAAGNDGMFIVRYPAGYVGVLGVSGVGRNREFATAAVSPCNDLGSTWGIHVDLAAPYWALSTVPGNNYEDESAPGFWCGTSMATPHVTAAAALLRDLSPTLNNYRVRQALYDGAIDRGPAGYDTQYGYGVLDANAAIQPYLPFTVSISGPSVVSPYDDFCEWSASVSGGEAPFQYQWSGILTGTSSTVSGSVSSPGWLYVDVFSNDGRIRSNSKYVTTSGDEPECEA